MDPWGHTGCRVLELASWPCPTPVSNVSHWISFYQTKFPADFSSLSLSQGLFIYLKVRVTEGEGETSHPLAHFPDGRDSCGFSFLLSSRNFLSANESQGTKEKVGYGLFFLSRLLGVEGLASRHLSGVESGGGEGRQAAESAIDCREGVGGWSQAVLHSGTAPNSGVGVEAGDGEGKKSCKML